MDKTNSTTLGSWNDGLIPPSDDTGDSLPPKVENWEALLGDHTVGTHRVSLTSPYFENICDSWGMVLHDATYAVYQERQRWCDDTVQGYYSCNLYGFWFQDEADLMMFKLKYGGKNG